MPATRILIVEDSAIQAELLRRLLVSEGYEVFVARDGAEGLEAAQKQMPALVISDINMPVMNGQEMCGKIKGDERLREIPVMLLTQLIDPEEVLRGLESGAEAYVTKPYDEEFLLARVHLMLEMPDSFKNIPDRKCIEFEYQKKHYVVRSGRSRTLSFLLSTYENALWHSIKLLKIQEELKKFNELLEEKVKGKTADLEAELAERKRAEAGLRESENRFRSLIQTAPVVILHLSPEGKILEFNPEAERIYGCRREEALDREYIELFIPAEAREGVREDIKKVLAGTPSMNYENPVKSFDRGIRLFNWNVSRLVDAKGVPAGIVAVGIDITERKQAEDMRLKHNKDLLAFVNLSSELMGLSLTEDIYKTICELAVGNFGLKMAWLGLIEEGTYSLRITAYSGFEDGYLSNTTITWDDTPEGMGTTGLAIKSKNPSVVNTIDTSPLYAPWRDEALKRGFHSSIALPLISSDGRVFGALNLYSGEQMFFTEKLTYILELFANHASIAIENANLIKSLEEKVEEITKADEKLKERIEELESFRKVTIKRELTMEKLRERVAELEEKLKGKL